LATVLLLAAAMTLNGFLWNQAELTLGDPLHSGLLMLLLIREDRSLQLIGTAFIVSANGCRATAISAAHNFEEIRKTLHPHLSHHSSTLDEFLPPPAELDLNQVKAIYTKDDKARACIVELSIWDRATDLAVLNIIVPDRENDLFSDLLWLDDTIPAVGDDVVMIGYGNMKTIADADRVGVGMIQRQLVLRLGKIEQVHLQGSHLVKAPCVETTIPVYGGMSGGIVARLDCPRMVVRV
jgi:Trypsin-like peptidase domain